jgi:putative transposase
MMQAEYPVTQLCSTLGLARSSFYRTSHKAEESQVCKAIEDLAAQYPTYGSRRISAQLRRDPHQQPVNRKRVRRLMRQMGLSGKQKRRVPLTTDSQHSYSRYPNLVKELDIVRPDQVWVADITYIQLSREEVYLAILMDVFTRGLRGWHLSRSLGQELPLVALNKALQGSTPEIHHSDQGGQYAAHAYVRRLQRAEVQISMAAVGQPTQNAYAERVIRSIKEEEVYLSEYHSLADASAQIGHFIDEVYQHKRIHSALGYLTPAEFEAHYYASL